MAAVVLDLDAAPHSETGASIIIDQSGTVIRANGLGQLLLDAEGAGPMLRQFALSGQSGQATPNLQVGLAGPPQRSFLFAAWPIRLADGASAIWLSGAETSIKDQLIDALSKSRAMFKDLAEVSGDFCWQVSDDGIFRYVSPTGALGYEAWDLNGHSPAMFGKAAATLFAAQEPITSQEIWLTAKDGQQRCLSLSVMPLINHGKWQGARGVARDVTELREAEARLQAARHYEALLQSILQAINASIMPADMLASAALAVRTGLFALGCQLSRSSGKTIDGHFDAASQVIIEAPCRIGEVAIGSIAVSRSEPWTSDAQDLLDRIAAHVAMAIAQANHLDDLEHLSLTDGLTGLRNRRAFDTEIQGRLARVNRHGGSGCLMLVDVDHFKQLNDGYGHQVGDQALRDIAAALQICVRTTDIVARLGGDEFAIWLEDSDVLGAERVATVMRSRVDKIAEQWPLVKPSLSIGIAPTKVGHSEFATLYERADEALYHVKRSGRNNTAIWGQDT
jgi:diguanylate cyclase (GGDEF)-like protein/PAS domain S-box-containing protein